MAAKKKPVSQPLTVRGRGRPTTLTPELQDRICDGIKAGLFAETVCAANGIDYGVHYRWMRTNADYCQAVRVAEMELQLLLLDVIRTGETGAGHALSLLERRFMRQWSIRTKSAVVEREDEILRLLRAGLTDDVFGKVLDALAGDGEGGAEAADGEGRRAKLPAA